MLVVAITATFDAASAAPLSVADAFKPSPILSMRLSPDGQRLLAFGWNGEASGAVVMDVATMTSKVLKSGLGGRPWTTRWLGKDLVVVAMPWDTQVFEPGGKLFRVFDGRFVALLPPDPAGHERILVARGGDYLVRIDVREDRSTRIPFEWPAGVARRWLMDRDGVPRVVTTATRDGTIVTHWYRASASEPWQAIESQLAVDSRWQPAAVSRDGQSLVVFSSEGRDTTAVFKYSLEEHALKELMAGHPSEDIGEFQQAGAGDDDSDDGDAGSFTRVVTMGMKPTVHWFDPRWAALQRAIDAALPDRINSLSGNPVAGRVLIFSAGDVDPGTWYLLDIATMSLREIDSRKTEIDRKAMAPTQIVRYRSADGLEIPAYLTLPPGGGSKLPAVVLVHGGPIVRDSWSWNPEVQMLASRGYAVLQPQFRGSAGFGQRFERAGYREWGRAMQDDVTAGAHWLVDQGIADAQRMCIYGASYGGYAALWALVKTPELFRCGASFAGVSDLRLMFEADSDVNRSEFGRIFEMRTIADSKADGERLDEVSPLRNAARIQVPVLLAHGDYDQRVPIVHSQKMRAALKAGGKQVEWIELPGEAHGIDRPANLKRFYDALFDFLARNTRPVPAAGAAASASASASAPAN